MSELQNRFQRITEMNDRASRIREFREETLVRPHLPRVLARKTVVRNGRLVGMLLMDGSRMYGRGRSFWINTGLHNGNSN